MGTITSLGYDWWCNASDGCITGSRQHLHTHGYDFFKIDLSKVSLTHNSLKTFVEGIFVTGTLNVNN